MVVKMLEQLTVLIFDLNFLLASMKLLTHSKNSPSNPLQRLRSGDSSMYIVHSGVHISSRYTSVRIFWALILKFVLFRS